MIYIGSRYAPSPINRLVTCPRERKRDRDRARKVAMSPEQRALLNKRQRELYAQKRHKKVCKDATTDSKGDLPINRYSKTIDFFMVKNFVVP